MRIITITLLWIFILFSDSFSQIGVVLNYKLKGQSIGETGVRGKFRVLFQPNLKRITGAIYYQEAGAYFPSLDEKDIIVDYAQKIKEYYTRESRSWLNISLVNEYALIKSSRIKITSKKVKNEIKTTVNLNLKASLGGKQKYIITFIYDSLEPEKVSDELKKYKQPSVADILSILINNEKVISEIAKRSLIRKYGIPDTIKVVWQQKGKTKLDVTITQKTKSIARFRSDAFAHRN